MGMASMLPCLGALLLCPQAHALATAVLPRASISPIRHATVAPFVLHRPAAMSAASNAADIKPAVAAEEPLTEDVAPAWRSKLVGVAKTAGSLGGIIAVDIALRRLFLAKAIPFPSSLAGMLLLFTSLCGLQAAVPSIAQTITATAAPGCAFISKWLAIFFVPNLVVLPLVLNFSPADAIRLAFVIVFGLIASLSLAGVTGSMILDSDESDTAPAATQAAAKSTPAASPPLSTLAPWGTTSVVLGVLAVLCHRVGAVSAAAVANLHLLVVTLGGYVAGGLMPAKVKKVLHPLITTTLVAIAAVGAFAASTSQPFLRVLRAYLVPGGMPLAGPGNLLLFMLGPATLSFGFGMFERRSLIKQSARALSLVIALSSSFGLFVTALVGSALKLAMPLRLAALSRQVTAPLAIAIAGMIGANPSLAASIVVITGLLAANFGRSILDALKVRSPVARGLAMGAAGHGIGTAAMAAEKEAFPFAAIAMALNAALSTVLVSIPAVRKLLLAAAGSPLP